MNALSRLLLPLSWLYGAAVWLRGRGYDLGLAAATDVAVPVVSVGNLSAGGTGKTPLVEYLVQTLLNENRRVAVVSRGYRRLSRGTVVVSDGAAVSASAESAGDEPYQIARKFPRAIVVVDEQKARAALLAVREFGADIVVVDDGFQHRALKRDLDLVVVDSTKPLRTMPLLPSGLRRDLLGSLSRADVLVYSRCQDPLHRHEEFAEAGRALRCCMESVLRRCVALDGGAEVPLASLAGARVAAFCAIGDPESFRRTLEAAGCSVEEFAPFADHHRFTEAELRGIGARAESRGARLILTTEKDAVRIMSDKNLAPHAPPGAAYLEIGVSFRRGESALRELLLRASPGRAA